MEINLQGNFKLRFDPNEVRVNIDGERIDVGARRDNNDYFIGTVKSDIELKSEDTCFRFESTDGSEFTDSLELLIDDHYYRDNKTNGSIHSGAYLKRKYGPKEED